jgi:membrane protein
VRDAIVRISYLPKLLRDAGSRWVDDRCYRLGASLAFYALFSLFPLLLLSITVIGFLLHEDQWTRQQLLSSVATATSPEFEAVLSQTLASMQKHLTARGISAVVGFVTLLFGASGVFSELQSSFNLIWRVEELPSRRIGRELLDLLKGKAMSFVIVVGAGLALLASLALTTALRVAAGPRVASPWRVLVEIVVSVGFLTGMFAVVFRTLPQTAVAWGDVLGGAFLTALVLTGLKHLLSWYFSHAGSYAAYGAVGAVLGLMMWIYVAGLLLFFGAEFTRVFAERSGSLRPAP